MAIEQADPFSNFTTGGYFSRDTGESVVTVKTNSLASGTIFSNLDPIENSKPIMGITVVDDFGNTQASATITVTNYANLLPAPVSATATITGILDDNTIPAALHGETITLIDAAGSPTTKTYKFMNSSTTNGAIDGGDGYIHIAIQGEDTKEGLVDNIEQAVEHANGHNGTISVGRSGAVLTLTQGTSGEAGNTTVTFSSGINTSTEVSKTNFTGGQNLARHTITLTATDGTVYSLSSSAAAVTTTTETTSPVFQATTDNNTTADYIRTAINALDRFTASDDGAVVTVTQVTGGTAGNTTITLTDPYSSGVSKTDFTGGNGPDLKLQGSHDGVNWVDLITLDTEFPATSGVYSYYPDLTNIYVPFWRMLANSNGEDMGKAGTAKFFYMYK